MKNTRRYVVLLLLVFLFAAPGLSAYFLYFHPQWLSSTTTNKGQLLNPPVLLGQLSTNSKWHLVLWSPAACEETCIEQLDKLARIRLALGRRLYDVDLSLLLGSNAKPMAAEQANMRQLQDVSVVTLSPEETQALYSLHPHSQLFVANPEQYLVLAYSVNAASDDLFHDIKLLLTNR